MQQYNYWGFGKNEPPPNLKTNKQLSAIGLAPKQPVAFIDTPKYTLYLYDPENPESVRPKRQATPQQLENLQKARAEAKRQREYRDWWRHEGFIEEDRSYAVQWARNFLTQDFVILDTETTGLDDTAQIVEIAVIDPQGQALINTLVCPTISSCQEAKSIHLIRDEMLDDAPTFPDVYPYLKQVLANKQIAIYNDSFDKQVIRYCCELHGLKKIPFKDRTHCLMSWYAQWYGEYSSYWRNYRYQPLNGGHTALTDCWAALELLKEMAEDDPDVQAPEYLKKPEDG